MNGIGSLAWRMIDTEPARTQRRPENQPARRDAYPPPAPSSAQNRRTPSTAAPQPPKRETHRSTARETAAREPGNSTQGDRQAATTGGVIVQSWRQDGGKREQGGDSQKGSAASEILAAAQAASVEAMALADELAALGGDTGIFEVILPCGAHIGVAVHSLPTSVRYLLSTSHRGLGHQLRNQKTKTELEGHLAQRIGRNVTLAVL